MAFGNHEISPDGDVIISPKFKVGETVLYQNGQRFELGIIKEVILDQHIKITHLKQDGLFGKPTGDEIMTHRYMYRVWYHTGETTALTDEDLLHKIANGYAFYVERREVNKPTLLEIENTKVCKHIELSCLYREKLKLYEADVFVASAYKDIDERIKILEAELEMESQNEKTK